MWAVIAPYLIRFGISLAVALLQRSGVLSAAEADGVRIGTHIIQATKTEDVYPTGVNGQTAPPPISQGAQNGNYNKPQNGPN